jgi:hypothetical protein
MIRVYAAHLIDRYNREKKTRERLCQGCGTWQAIAAFPMYTTTPRRAKNGELTASTRRRRRRCRECRADQNIEPLARYRAAMADRRASRTN